MGEIFALIALGVLVGVLIGGLGGGGGVVAVPMFIWIGGMRPTEAGTYSLIAVAGAAVVAVAMGSASKEVRWKWAMLFGLVGIVGAVIGSIIAASVDDTLLLVAFAIIVILAAIQFVHGIVRDARHPSESKPPVWCAPLAATGIGAVTGLVGVGGGFLIAPALMRIVRLVPRTAIATSSAVILFNSLSSLASRALIGFDVDPHLVVPVLIGAIAGSVVGRLIAARVSARALQFGSAGLLGVCGVAVSASLLQTVGL